MQSGQAALAAEDFDAALYWFALVRTWAPSSLQTEIVRCLAANAVPALPVRCLAGCAVLRTSVLSWALVVCMLRHSLAGTALQTDLNMQVCILHFSIGGTNLCASVKCASPCM